MTHVPSPSLFAYIKDAWTLFWRSLHKTKLPLGLITLSQIMIAVAQNHTTTNSHTGFILGINLGALTVQFVLYYWLVHTLIMVIKPENNWTFKRFLKAKFWISTKVSCYVMFKILCGLALGIIPGVIWAKRYAYSFGVVLFNDTASNKSPITTVKAPGSHLLLFGILTIIYTALMLLIPLLFGWTSLTAHPAGILLFIATYFANVFCWFLYLYLTAQLMGSAEQVTDTYTFTPKTLSIVGYTLLYIILVVVYIVGFDMLFAS